MDLGCPEGMDFLMATIHMGTEGAAFLSGPCWEWHLLNKIFTSSFYLSSRAAAPFRLWDGRVQAKDSE